MGLLDEYGIDMDEIEAPSFDVPDDIYEFEVTDFYIQDGTDNYPDRVWLVIQYSLGSGGKSKSEWFELPADASAPTDKELQKLGFYKNRLRDLGIEDSQMNAVGPDDLIGKTGTLQVFTKNGFQNIKGVKLSPESMDGLNEFAKEEVPAPRRSRAAKPAAKPAPEPEPEADETPEEPEEKPVARGARRTPPAAASTAKARQAGVKPNPFRS
jgi:hypothetical protein